MKENTPLKKIIELIDTGNNIFITGGGGVGKSYILRKLKERYKNELEITSTTGISAFNVEGQTIHSWAYLSNNVERSVKRINNNRSMKKQILKCKRLAIDEISMLSNRLLERLNEILQRIRNNDEVFGGIQVIFIGDFFQLPPVRLAEALKEDPGLDFCFRSPLWTEDLNLTTVYLKEVKRQSDKQYIDALNRVRIGEITEEDQDLFYSHNYIDDNGFSKDILRIFPHKQPAKIYNDNCYNEIKSKEYIYPSVNTIYKYSIDKNNIEIKKSYSLDIRPEDLKLSEFDHDCIDNFFNKECRADKILKLKVGCRVMLIKNMDFEKGLVNGALGEVINLTDTSIEVKFENGEIVKFEELEKFEYVRGEKTRIIREQYPLILAFAISTHKSQGMTFDKLVINFGSTFGHGMGYVSLSRTCTLDGLIIIGFDPEKIKVEQKVKNFYKKLEKDPKCIIFGNNDNEKNIIENDYDTNVDDIITENKYIEEESDNIKDTQHEKENNEDKRNIEDVINSMKLDLKEGISNEIKAQIKDMMKEAVLEVLSQHKQSKNQESSENIIEKEVEENNSIEDIIKDEEDIENINDIKNSNKKNYFIRAFNKYKEEEYDESFDLFIKHLEENPNDDKAYNYLGRICEIEEDYESAVDIYSKAITLEPDSTIYLSRRANAYYKIKEYKKAVQDWNKVLKLDPEYEIDYFYKGYAEHELENYNQAIKDYTTYLESHSDSAITYNNRGWAKECSDDFNYDDAIKDYTKAIKLDKNNAMYFNNRANAYCKIEEYKKAVQDWNKVLKLDLEYKIDYFYKGYAEHELENYNQAIKDYTTYLESHPDDAAAYNNRGLTKECLEGFYYDDAIKDYTKAIKLDKNNTMYLNNRARAYYKIKEYKKAVQDWNKVLKLDPEYKIDYFYKGYAEGELDNHKQSISDYTKYLKNNPDNASAYNNRGLAYYYLSNYENAINDYSIAINLKSDEKMYLKNRANAFFECKNYDQAIQDYNKVLELNPNNDDTYNRRGLAYDELKEYQKAICDYNKAIELNSNNVMYFFNRANAYYILEDDKKAKADYLKVLENKIDDTLCKEIKGILKDIEQSSSNNEAEKGNISELPTDYEELLYQIEQEHKKGHYKKVIEICENIIEIVSEDIKICNLLAESYYNNEDYEEAIDVWNKVLEIDFEYDIDYFKKAYAEDELGEYDQAIKDYTIYLGNYPDNAGAYNNRGLAKEYSDNYIFEESIKDYNEAIKLEPDNTIYLNNRANLYFKIRCYEKAQEDYLKVLEFDIDEGTYKEINEKLEELKILSSNDIKEKLSKARKELNKGDYDKVIMLCEQVLSTAKDTDAYFIKGNAHYLDNNKFDAKIDYKTALVHNPKYGKAWFNLGIIEEDAGRDKSALYNYEKAIKFDKSIKDLVKKKIKNLKNKISKNKDYDSFDSYNYEDDYD